MMSIVLNKIRIDTLELSRTMDNTYSRHSLSALAKRYNIIKSEDNPDGFWDESSHHRGDYDAEGTARVFAKMLQKLMANLYIRILYKVRK